MRAPCYSESPRRSLVLPQVYNKIDSISLEEVDRLARLPHTMVMSCELDLNLEVFKRRVWEKMGFNRVYTKKRGEQPDLGDPLVIKTDATMEAVVSSVACLCAERELTVYTLRSATAFTGASRTSSSASCFPSLACCSPETDGTCLPRYAVGASQKLAPSASPPELIRSSRIFCPLLSHTRSLGQVEQVCAAAAEGRPDAPVRARRWRVLISLASHAFEPSHASADSRHVAVVSIVTNV